MKIPNKSNHFDTIQKKKLQKKSKLLRNIRFHQKRFLEFF